MVEEFSTNTNLIAFNRERIVRDMDSLIPVYASYGIRNLDLNFCEMMRPESRLNDSRSKGYIRRLEDLRKEYGLNYIGSHAPYSQKGEKEGETEYKIFRAIEFAAILRCPYIVVHPVRGTVEENIRYYGKFRGSGILIAIENMESDKEISRHSEINEIIASNPEGLRALFDTGHANLLGLDLKEEIMGYKDNLIGLHIHDNDGRSDQHLIPFMGNIDWRSFISGLREIGYKGLLTYEAMYYSRNLSINDEGKVIREAVSAFNRLIHF